jgi:hypothetical protein
MRGWFILLLGLSLSASSWGSLFPSTWDREFKSATEVFLPVGTDWRLLKAQCWQESRLQPLAVSPVGAYGLCQFMPGTAGDVAKVLKVSPDQFWLPEVSIRAAGFYMGRLHRTWSAPRPAMDRYMIAAASYNAGAGHLIRAQSICGGGNLYREIIPCLPQVTGRHSAETIDYVQKIIGQWWPRMMLQ